MFASQFIFVALVLFIIYKTIVSYKKNHLSKPFIILWLTFWAFVLFILFDQRLLSKMAKTIGIGRGVDLAVYFSIIIIFYVIYMLLVKIHQLENKITKIIRELAIKNIK